MTTASIEHCPPGQPPDPAALRPGDFTLHRATTTKGKGGATTTLGKLIQAGERTRFGNSDFARWTHSTIVLNENGDIAEAIEKGVLIRNLEKYKDTDFVVVHVTADDEQRAHAVAFARIIAERHAKYGVLNFIGLAVQSLFGWTISVHMDSQFICSGLVARATEKYIDAYARSPENMMPGDLAHYWKAQSGEPLPKLGFFGHLLDLLVTFFGLFRNRKPKPPE